MSRSRPRTSGTMHKYAGDTVNIKYAGRFEYRLVGTNNVFTRVSTPFGQSIDRSSSTQTTFARAGVNRYLYNGKELQIGSGYLDYGARMYMPEVGRFSTQDRYAEKYYALNPYQYTANNPMNLIDRNGDSITVALLQGGGTNGKDLYKIHVSGKVVDDTQKGLCAKQLDRIAKQVSKQIEKSFKGNDKTMEFETTTDITVANQNNQLQAGDHAFRIVDDVATSVGQTDPPGGNIKGFGPAGQNVVYIEKGGNYSRTGAHELGHSAMLPHPKDEINPATGFKYKISDFPGNLMHQSVDMNSSGQSAAGTKIAPSQIKTMYRMYSIPAMNRGKQK